MDMNLDDKIGGNPFKQVLLLMGLCLVGFLVANIVMAVFMMVNQVALDENYLSALSVSQLKWLQSIQLALIFFLPALICFQLFRKRKQQMLIPSFRWSTFYIGTAMVVTVCAFPVINFLKYYNEQMVFPELFSSLEATFRSWEDQANQAIELMLSDHTLMGFLGSILVIGVVAAVCEELFFRGMLQPILCRLFKNVHLGVWLTAIVFSAIHFQFFGFLPRLFIGALLGYMVVYSGSLMPAIVSHLVNNVLAVILFYIFSDDKSGLNYVEHIGTGKTWSYSLFGLLAIFLVIKVWQYRQKPKTPTGS